MDGGGDLLLLAFHGSLVLLDLVVEDELRQGELPLRLVEPLLGTAQTLHRRLTRTARGDDGPGDYFFDPAGRARRRTGNEIAGHLLAGVAVLSRRALRDPPGGAFGLTPILDRAEEEGRLFALAHDGVWFRLRDAQDAVLAEVELGYRPMPAADVAAYRTVRGAGMPLESLSLFYRCGAARALAPAYRITRRGGTTVTAGLPHPQQQVALSHVSLVAEERTLKGSYLGSCVPERDIPQYIDWYRSGRLPVDKLLSERIRLDDLNAAFDRLAAGASIRQVVELD